MSAMKYRLRRRSSPMQKSPERHSLMSLLHWTLGEHQSARKGRCRVKARHVSGSKLSMTILANPYELSGSRTASVLSRQRVSYGQMN